MWGTGFLTLERTVASKIIIEKPQVVRVSKRRESLRIHIYSRELEELDNFKCPGNL